MYLAVDFVLWFSYSREIVSSSLLLFNYRMRTTRSVGHEE